MTTVVESAPRRLLSRVTRLNREGFDLAAGLRVAISLTVPIVVGVLIGRTLDGVFAAFGGLNVAMAEGAGSYSTRGLRVGSVLIGNAVGIGLGVVVAGIGWWGLPVTAGWILLTSYAGVMGPIAERVGWFAGLLFIIGLGLDGLNAGRVMLDVLIGGAWAIIVVAALWPLQPHRPALRAIGKCQLVIAEMLEQISRSDPLPVIVATSAKAAAAIQRAEAASRWSWVRSRSGQDAQRRLRQLVLQSERAHTSAVAVDQELQDPGHFTPAEAAEVRQALGQLGAGFAGLAAVFLRGRETASHPVAAESTALAQRIGGSADWISLRVSGVARLCEALALIATEEESTGLELDAGEHPTASLSARIRATVERAATALRANLTPSSFWLRYAVRYSLAISVAFVISQGFELTKGYWVLLTVAIVVKPQLSLSTTQTVHRIAGTIIGALLAVLIIITCTDRWALIVALFVLSLLAISLVDVSYGLSVVFITPLVLVIVNVPHPGQWELADVRVLNTLIGAAIGLLATTAILRGSERGLVPQRGEVALLAAADYLRAIGRETTQDRLNARFAARTKLDDLLTVVDRAIVEPQALESEYLNAATRLGDLVRRLWDATVVLASGHPADRVDAELRAETDEQAANVETVAAILAGRPSEPTTPQAGGLAPFDAIATELREVSLDLVSVVAD